MPSLASSVSPPSQPCCNLIFQSNPTQSEQRRDAKCRGDIDYPHTSSLATNSFKITKIRENEFMSARDGAGSRLIYQEVEALFGLLDHQRAFGSSKGERHTRGFRKHRTFPSHSGCSILTWSQQLPLFIDAVSFLTLPRRF